MPSSSRQNSAQNRPGPDHREKFARHSPPTVTPTSPVPQDEYRDRDLRERVHTSMHARQVEVYSPRACR